MKKKAKKTNSLTQAEHLIKWIRANKQFKRSVIAEESEMNPVTLSRLVTEKTKPKYHHYTILVDYCVKLGYTPININADNQ
jgi:hypothetical protein